jgi:bacillithiol biosynthesis deacetylase BshB1
MSAMDEGAYDVAVVAPHPDDAEIGCGGAIARASAAGGRVAIIDLTDGERASRGTPASRRAESKTASGLLGVIERVRLAWPDGALVTTPGARDELATVLRRLRPRIVLAPHWEDRHPDHAVAGRLSRDACFAAGLAGGYGETRFRPGRVFHYMIHSPFDPSFVLDISDVWPVKRAAIEAYESQFGVAPGAETPLSGGVFLGMVQARAEYFGAMVGARYGEPYFHLGPVSHRRLPGWDDPPSATGALPPYTMY